MKRRPTVILGYHSIRAEQEDGRLAEDTAFYTVPRDQFKAQMDFLGRQGFSSILPDEFLADVNNRSEKQIMITFDDGHESDFTLALTILHDNGFRAVFFICVDFVGRPGYMNWHQIRTLAASGMSIQSHGLFHHNLTRLSESEVSEELRNARLQIEEHIGRSVRYISVPGGFVDASVYRAAELAGYRAVFNSKLKAALPGRALPRIAIRRDTTLPQFQDFAAQKWRALVSAQLLDAAKSTLKATVGVERYESIKRKVMS